FRLGVLALTDHPRDYAAGATRPGVAYADLAGGGVPDWVVEAIATLKADAILVTPHWGWNMMAEPMGHVRAASRALLAGGATLLRSVRCIRDGRDSAGRSPRLRLALALALLLSRLAADCLRTVRCAETASRRSR